MIRVTEVEQTCWACPSQWEGTTAGGQYVYARYRFGRLTVSCEGREVFAKTAGDEWDGVLGYDELKAHTGGVLVWP